MKNIWIHAILSGITGISFALGRLLVDEKLLYWLIFDLLSVEGGRSQIVTRIILYVTVSVLVSVILVGVLMELYSFFFAGKDTKLYLKNEKLKKSKNAKGVVRITDRLFVLIFAVSSFAVIAKIHVFDIWVYKGEFGNMIANILKYFGVWILKYLGVFIAQIIVYFIIKAQIIKIVRAIKNARAWR